MFLLSLLAKCTLLFIKGTATQENLMEVGGGGGDGQPGRVSVYSVQLSSRRVMLMSQRKEVAVSACRSELTRALRGHAAHKLSADSCTVNVNQQRFFFFFFFSLSVLQEITMHASLPPGLCGPVAGHQPEVSNLSG